MSKSVKLRKMMREEIEKLEEKITDRVSRLEELSANGADHTDSEFMSKAEAFIGHAETYLGRARTCSAGDPMYSYKMFRRHLMSMTTVFQKIDAALDDFSAEIDQQPGMKM